MRLKESLRHPAEPFAEFLRPETVKEVLAAYERSQGDRRTSECKDVVSHDARHLVFIRRAERPDLVLRAGGLRACAGVHWEELS